RAGPLGMRKRLKNPRLKRSPREMKIKADDSKRILKTPAWGVSRLTLGLVFCALLLLDGQSFVFFKKSVLGGAGISAAALFLAAGLFYFRNEDFLRKKIYLTGSKPEKGHKTPPVPEIQTPIWGIGTALAAAAYFLYDLFLFWRPLTHPQDVVGEGDMVSYCF